MNPDKIKTVLVATNHLHMIGGSELYTYYLIKALNQSGEFSVEYFTLEKGVISDKVENELCVPFMSRDHYDLILANHYTTVERLKRKGPVIQICHGIVPGLEDPSPFADFHVAISQEVSSILSAKGYCNKVILNGVDLACLAPRKEINPELRSVLSLCQSDSANEKLFDICSQAGIRFDWIDKNKNPEFYIADKINNADLVVGIGRSIYDAMACGRTCIIFDDRHYNGNKGDGYLFPHRFDDFVKHNCSGRFSSRRFNREDLRRELELYNSEDGKKMRAIAEDKLNAAKMAKKLIETSGNINLKTRINKWMRRLRKRN